MLWLVGSQLLVSSFPLGECISTMADPSIYEGPEDKDNSASILQGKPQRRLSSAGRLQAGSSSSPAEPDVEGFQLEHLFWSSFSEWVTNYLEVGKESLSINQVKPFLDTQFQHYLNGYLSYKIGLI